MATGGFWGLCAAVAGDADRPPRPPAPQWMPRDAWLTPLLIAARLGARVTSCRAKCAAAWSSPWKQTFAELTVKMVAPSHPDFTGSRPSPPLDQRAHSFDHPRACRPALARWCAVVPEAGQFWFGASGCRRGLKSGSDVATNVQNHPPSHLRALCAQACRPAPLPITVPTGVPRASLAR